MQVTAGQIFKELEQGKWKPFYLIVGEEPFQAGELLERLKQFFLKDPSAAEFSYESFDGDQLDGGAALASLETMPGLFAQVDATRLIYCSRFDRASPAALEVLEGYFANPAESSCFVMTAAKADKRKAWVKHVDQKGYLVEVAEPYDRDWPKWQGYFERKLKKRFEGEAWAALVETAGRSLSLIWTEAQKLSLYVGEKPTITAEIVREVVSGSADADVFAFAEEVLCGRRAQAADRYRRLVRDGEADVKLLSILVRQFRQVDQVAALLRAGVTDGKAIASRVGIHPYFVPKVIGQAKHQSEESLASAFQLLADSDYRLKTGDGALFETFLVPYFLAREVR